MNIEPGLAFHGSQARHVDEARVQEMSCRRRDHGERKSAREIAACILEGWNVVRQSVEPERSRGLRMEFHFRGGSGEVAVCKAGSPARRAQAFPAVLAHRVEIPIRGQGALRDLAVRVLEAGLDESHGVCEQPEYLRVGL